MGRNVIRHKFGDVSGGTYCLYFVLEENYTFLPNAGELIRLHGVTHQKLKSETQVNLYDTTRRLIPEYCVHGATQLEKYIRTNKH
jgi:hypothetical protein